MVLALTRTDDSLFVVADPPPHAQVGGSLRGKVFVAADVPQPAVANGMGNWHNLVPRVSLGAYQFLIGCALPLPQRNATQRMRTPSTPPTACS